jgi:hypothetical protein
MNFIRPLSQLLTRIPTTLTCLAAASTFCYQGQQTTPPTPKPHDDVPIVMTECEGIDNCAAWTFLGVQGNGQWRTGEVANLNVVSVNETKIVIRRADSTGAKAGLTAVYEGTRTDNQIGGDVTSKWPGHWEGEKRGKWYAILGTGGQERPAVMHLCPKPPGQDCATFKWENGQYTNYTNLPGQFNEKRVLTVERFTRESVILHRVDYGSYPLTAEMTGRISSDGNRLEDGSIKFTSFGGNPRNDSHPILMTWGDALNSIPGSDDLDRAQTSQLTIQQPIVVTPSDVMTVLDWIQVFQRFHDMLSQ